jgi:HPt (histidine-containing phosphotransfer) domain-containing protein
MHHNTLARLIRILGLLGSEHPGERDSAARAAHRLVASAGTSWAELLGPKAAPPKVIVRRVREYGIDPEGAAAARMRQLKATNDRLEQQVLSLRRRLAAMAERDRRARALAEGDDEPPRAGDLNL